MQFNVGGMKLSVYKYCIVNIQYDSVNVLISLEVAICESFILTYMYDWFLGLGQSKATGWWKNKFEDKIFGFSSFFPSGLQNCLFLIKVHVCDICFKVLNAYRERDGSMQKIYKKYPNHHNTCIPWKCQIIEWLKLTRTCNFNLIEVETTERQQSFSLL